MITEIVQDVIVQRLCKETSVACSIYRERRRSPEKCCHFRHLDGQNFPQSGRSMGSVQDYVSVTLDRPNTQLCSAKRRRRSLFKTIAVSAVHGARIREDRRRRSPFSRLGPQLLTLWPPMGSVQDYFYVTLNRHNTRIRSAKRRRRSLFTTPAVCAVRGARIREDRRRRSRFR